MNAASEHAATYIAVPATTASAMTHEQWMQAWSAEWKRRRELEDALELMAVALTMIVGDKDDPLEYAGVTLYGDPGYMRGVAMSALCSLEEKGLFPRASAKHAPPDSNRHAGEAA